MLQKKRQQFKKQIRRRHIQKLFADKRSELLQHPQAIQQLYTNYQSNQSKGIQSAIQNIIFKVEHENYLSTQIQFNFLIRQLQSNNTETSFFLTKRYQHMVYLIKCVIKNEQKIQEKMQWRKMNAQIQFYFLEKLFKILSLLNYGLLREEPYQYLISSFWLYYTWREFIFDNDNSKRIFDLSLQILKQMLLGQNKIVLQQLKARGLGSQIIKITSHKLKDLSRQNQRNLIEVIFHYIDLEIRLKQRDFQSNINGITIMGIQSSQKTHLMAFALYILDIKPQQTQELYALKTLIRIFQMHQYLIDSLKNQSIAMICNLVQSNDRNVSNKALQLLDDVTFHGKEDIYEHLLEKIGLLDVLKHQIEREMKYQDDCSRNMITYIVNILCNVTLVNKKQKLLIKNMIKHPIWQLCYQNIHISTPFLELIAVFQYYFAIIGRNNIMNFFQPYLYAVSQLDFNLIDRKQAQTIKRTIQRLFLTAQQYWPEGYSQKIKQLCQINRLSFILEEMFEVQLEQL